MVTGASGGIGGAVARALARSAADLVLVARGVDRLRAVADAVGGAAVQADVSTESGVARVVGAVRERWGAGAPDVLVNAAGAFVLAPFVATSAADFDAMLAHNLRAPFLTIRAFLPAMLERGSGHIVTIGSVAGRRPLPHNAAYGAAKFGVRGLHAILSEELRGSGVRATLVEPGATDTPLWDAVDRGATPGLPPREAMLPAREVAEAVLYAVTRPAGAAVSNIVLGAD